MIAIPLQPSERWDAPQSAQSRPDLDLIRLSPACGVQFERLLMSPTALRMLTIHPWFREEHRGLWVCGQGTIQMIPAPTLESIERVLGASAIGPILPGSLEVDAAAGADVIAEWDGGRAMLVGVLDATNTTLYGAIASGTEREWVREQERRSR